MKRRMFLTKTVIAAGAASSLKSFLPFKASGMDSKKPFGIPTLTSDPSGATKEDIRSADYLRRVRGDKYLPDPPVFAESFQSPDVRISPMSLAERL